MPLPSASIVETNLSVAWAKAFVTCMSVAGGELTPLSVTITDFPAGVGPGCVPENGAIRLLLDTTLRSLGKTSCDTVANTIFPWSYWNPTLPADRLFQRYERAWQRIKTCRANRNGVYFRRLVSFNGQAQHDNQLKHIVDTWRSGNHRRSALLAVIFDPARDHTNSRQRGFPCMQLVSFAPEGATGLGMTAFYATQYLFQRAYGNYLGLCRLGKFMAKEMGRELTRVTCYASVAMRGSGARPLQGLEQQLQQRLLPWVP